MTEAQEQEFSACVPWGRHGEKYFKKDVRGGGKVFLNFCLVFALFFAFELRDEACT